MYLLKNLNLKLFKSLNKGKVLLSKLSQIIIFILKYKIKFETVKLILKFDALLS